MYSGAGELFHLFLQKRGSSSFALSFVERAFVRCTPLEGCLLFVLLIRKWSCVGGVCVEWSSGVRMSCFYFGLLGNIINAKASVTEKILSDTVDLRVFFCVKIVAGFLNDVSKLYWFFENLESACFEEIDGNNS